MMRNRFLGVLLATLATLLATAPVGAISLGQVDDFQAGGFGNWEPTFFSSNVATGGPAGAGDRFLQYTSSGSGAGGKMIIFNSGQWAGDYAAAGVDQITLYAINKGSTPLFLRLAIGTGTGFAPASNGTWYGSNDAVVLPANDTWTEIAFDLTTAAMTQIMGSEELASMITGVSQLRILSAAGGPATRGDAIAGTLGLDEITAVPEPSASMLVGVGLAWLSAKRRPRR